MRTALSIGAILVAVVAAIAVAGWFGVRQALRHQPGFYVQALERPAVAQQEAGRQLEREVLHLHNQLRHEGRWEARFTVAEMNGWLAADLEEKFPKLLPAEAKDPRVAVEGDRLLVACRYQSPRLNTVISLAIQARLTEQANVIAFRVLKARAGAMPVPLSRFLNQVSTAAARSGVQLRWAQEEGDPVALVQLEPRHPEHPDRRIELDRLELEGDELVLGGTVAQETTVADQQALSTAEDAAVTR